MTQAEIKTKIAELKKKAENPSLPASAKSALEKMITDLENKIIEEGLKSHKGGSSTAKEEADKLKKEGYKKRGDKYVKETTSEESEDWKDELYDLIYSDVPEAQKEWAKLSEKKKKEFIEYCYDLATDFSNAGNWEDGKKPTKSEVKKQLLDVVEPEKKSDKKDSKKETKTEKKSTGEYNCDELIEEAKKRTEKAKQRAEERANEPKKTEGTKAKEKVEKTHGTIEKLIESGKLKKAQIEKILAETKELVKLLENALKSL